MFTILNKQIIANDVKRIDVQAEAIARRVQPGQFVMVIAREHGVWVPLSVVEADPRKGTITLIFQEIGPALQQLGAIPIKETIYSIMGPLGQPSACTKKYGIVVCVASGGGAAQMLPVCRVLSKLGNKVIGILGAKNRRDLILEPQMRLACHKIYIATNDSTSEKKGSESGIVKQLLDQQVINLVYAVGNVDMMQAIAGMTQKKMVPLFVQVHPVMCCGTGFCGSCRINVGHQTVLACEQGPEFDGHKVDFNDLRVRLGAYDTTDTRIFSKAQIDPGHSSGRTGRNSFSKFFTGILKAQ